MKYYKLASIKNSWFTDDNLQLLPWLHGLPVLTKNEMENWLSSYELPVKQPKTIAIVMAQLTISWIS